MTLATLGGALCCKPLLPAPPKVKKAISPVETHGAYKLDLCEASYMSACLFACQFGLHLAAALSLSVTMKMADNC